jgi:wyosine [tRNA(Phe)-imidazoG37] synthetase (radical SAM superfamily)
MKSYRYLYGPVPSRRLGRSLGVDLVPPKICTYDCVYCQVGKTTERTLQRKEYIPTEEVLDEVKDFLSEREVSIDHFSLSGSGEPTLHSQIGAVIKGIKGVSPIPVAVLTNGSLLYLDEVRNDLLQADIILPSLDAVSKEVFTRINRPHRGISVEKVVEGLAQFRKVYQGQIWLEILFCKGINDGSNELHQMKAAIDRIRPDRIHINTVVRPPTEPWATPLSLEEMEMIQAFLGDGASIISEFDRHPLSLPEINVKEEIFRILKRRPLSLVDLSQRMAIQRKNLRPRCNRWWKRGKSRADALGIRSIMRFQNLHLFRNLCKGVSNEDLFFYPVVLPHLSMAIDGLSR